MINPNAPRVHGPYPPEEAVVSGEDNNKGTAYRLEKPHRLSSPHQLRSPDPPLKRSDPFVHTIADWCAARAINGVNWTRSFVYAAWSLLDILRWGRVHTEVAWLRSLWCYGGPGKPPCKHLVWDIQTSDWYCGGDNGGQGCGCGQTKLARLWFMLKLAGKSCPIGNWGTGASASHPDYVKLETGESTCPPKQSLE